MVATSQSVGRKLGPDPFLAPEKTAKTPSSPDGSPGKYHYFPFSQALKIALGELGVLAVRKTAWQSSCLSCGSGLTPNDDNLK